MAFTRYHDDPVRINKHLEESTFSGRYLLDTPGPGTDLPFFADAQMRLQKWGANLTTDTVNLESDLRGIGLGRRLNHDYSRTYQNSDISSPQPQSFPDSQVHVEESRATHPAWMYKDLDHTRWETPILNPQRNLEKGFHDNIQTRILEKDYFRAKVPAVAAPVDNNHGFEYASPASSQKFTRI
jgi:hypothetical protein